MIEFKVPKLLIINNFENEFNNKVTDGVTDEIIDRITDREAEIIKLLQENPKYSIQKRKFND